MKDDRKTVPCKLCSVPTPYTGTELCDRCWELEGRIRRDPDIAAQVLSNLGYYVASPVPPKEAA